MEKFIKSHKNNPQLFLDGYTYESNGLKNGTRYYRCIYNSKGCWGTCNEKDGVINKRKDHSHEPEYEEKDKKDFYAGLKNAASTSISSTPKRIVADFIMDKNDYLLNKISGVSPLKKRVQRIKHKNENHPPAPRNSDGFIIAGNYALTGKNEQFLQAIQGSEQKD